MDDLLFYVRAVHFAATITIAGTVFFVVLIAEPAFRVAAADSQVPLIIRGRVRWIAWTALLLTVLSGAAWLAVVAQTISDRPWTEVFSQGIVLTLLARTGFGHVWLVRLVTLCALAVAFVPFLSGSPAKSVPPKLVVATLAAGLIGLLAFAGHGAGGFGLEGVAHPAADIVHLIAAGAWVGGLLPLALLLAACGREATSIAVARTATLRFSALGVVCVAALIITGAVNTFYLAGSIAALTETDYGHLLLIKVALFVAMIAIAAVNRLQLTPRLALAANGAARKALRQLRRNVAIEIAAGAVVIAVVAVLGVTPPAHLQHVMPPEHHHSD